MAKTIEIFFLIVQEAGKSKRKILSSLVPGWGLSSWLSADCLLPASLDGKEWKKASLVDLPSLTRGYHRLPTMRWEFLTTQLVENLPAMQETWVWSLGWKDPLEKGKATHSSILAWRIPWTTQPMGSQRLSTTEQLSLHLGKSQVSAVLSICLSCKSLC